MEAETSCAVEDEFTPSLKMKQLVPSIDYSTISSYPLLALQVTYFKGAGVCVGVGWNHVLGDGISAFNFIKLWAEIRRGFSIIITPFINRTILNAYTAPYPSFNHIEYHPPPSMNIYES
ncbi:hypothetical protein Pint_14405 [Pistacia integerrima]|uniref:Uncharacterized protein n=1 Tax=Pistacia integerrima TaxID=434235 RepID=A0ACC0Y6T6_9ROSI|nr:hypothetical protein Pint_14405 [Pistacia integerrima]